jgi:hypothetical protein
MARPTKVKDGDVYGPLRVLNRVESVRIWTPTWRVQCILCGEEANLTGSALLKSRYAIGCSACAMEQAKKLNYKTGTKVGSLTLKTRATHAGHRSSWYATCECGAVDVYRTRELHEITGAGLVGCRVCNPVVKAAREPADILQFSYKDEMGLRMQHLYLHGLIPT